MKTKLAILSLLVCLNASAVLPRFIMMGESSNSVVMLIPIDDEGHPQSNWWSVMSAPTAQTGMATSNTVFQPINGNLTSIAALPTTPFGRLLLTNADAPTLRGYLILGTLATQSGTFSGTSTVKIGSIFRIRKA